MRDEETGASSPASVGKASLSFRPSIPPALFALLAEGFLSRLSFGIISFALPVFAYRKLGLSLTETGLLFSLNLIAEQMFKPLMGWIADHTGVKRTFTVAIALRSLVALLLVGAAAPWQVYAIRFLHGFAESLRDPSVSVLISENANKQKMASAYAWYTTAKMSAGSVGNALGGVLLAITAEHYGQIFAVAFALSLLPLWAVIRYVKEPAPVAKESALENYNGEAAAPVVENEKTSLWPAVVLGFLISCTARMISQLFPVLALEYAKLTPAQTSVIYACSLAAVIGAGPLFGWLSDHVSRKLVLMVRGVANTFSTLMFWFFPNFAGLALGNVADSLGKAAFRPAWGALMAQLASLDRRRRARTMSYLSLGEGLGETLGPLLGGFLWHTWGLAALLGVRMGLAVAGEIYALWIARFDKTISSTK